MVRLYRSRDEIVVDILKATFEWSRKTHIMQRANLNPAMFRKYFPMLLERGLIVENDGSDGGSVYRLTDDGKDFLRMSILLHNKLGKKARETPVYLLK